MELQLIYTVRYEISFQEALDRFFEQYPDESKRLYMRNLLKEANRQFQAWAIASIPENLVGEIVVPWNRSHRDNNYNIVPPTGEKLSNVNRRFHNDIRCHAPNFYKRILEIKEAKRPIGHIFLSDSPLICYGSYKQLDSWKGFVTILDGFHRLLALLQSDAQLEQLEAVIALSVKKYE